MRCVGRKKTMANGPWEIVTMVGRHGHDVRYGEGNGREG